MTIYAANENGDWWEIPDNTLRLWILNTDRLPADLTEDLEDEINSDKFHRFIWQHGMENIIGN